MKHIVLLLSLILLQLLTFAQSDSLVIKELIDRKLSSFDTAIYNKKILDFKWEMIWTGKTSSDLKRVSCDSVRYLNCIINITNNELVLYSASDTSHYKNFQFKFIDDKKGFPKYRLHLRSEFLEIWMGMKIINVTDQFLIAEFFEGKKRRNNKIKYYKVGVLVYKRA